MIWVIIVLTGIFIINCIYCLAKIQSLDKTYDIDWDANKEVEEKS